MSLVLDHRISADIKLVTTAVHTGTKCIKAAGHEKCYCEMTFIMKGCFDGNLGSRQRHTNYFSGVPLNFNWDYQTI